MINNPESNIKFTDNQAEQLKAFRGQLSNIQMEVTIATNHLQSIKDDGIKAFKDKTYLESLIPNLQNEVDRLGAHKDSLQEEISKIVSALEENNKLIKQQTEKNQVKIDELVSRETKLKDAEQAHETKALSLSQASTKLSEQQLLVEKAKDAFLKATESILWK